MLWIAGGASLLFAVAAAPASYLWAGFGPVLITAFLHLGSIVNYPHYMATYELAVCDIDLRVGGRYRFVERDRDGRTFAFIGEYREIVVPEKLVFTLAFEGMADADALQTIRFEEHAGKTTIHSIAVYKSVAARDGHIRNGMEGGMRESYDRMTALLAALPKT